MPSSTWAGVLGITRTTAMPVGQLRPRSRRCPRPAASETTSVPGLSDAGDLGQQVAHVLRLDHQDHRVGLGRGLVVLEHGDAVPRGQLGLPLRPAVGGHDLVRRPSRRGAARRARSRPSPRRRGWPAGQCRVDVPGSPAQARLRRRPAGRRPARRSAPRSARRPCAGCRWRRTCTRPLPSGADWSTRIRPTKLGSWPAASSGVGTSISATPGAAASSAVAWSGLRSSANSAWMASEWPVKTGHPYAGAGDPQVRDVQDLARLVAELLLLVGLAPAVVDDRPGQRQHVVGDRS